MFTNLKTLAVITATTLTLSMPSMAKDSFDDHQLTMKVSTVGVGPEYRYSIDKEQAIRVGVFMASGDTSAIESGIDYSASLDAKNAMLSYDYNVSDNIRVTAGLLSANTVTKLSATTASSYDIGGQTFAGSDIGSIDSSFNITGTVPYIGLGFASSPANSDGWEFSFDMGVAQKPDITADMTATCSATASASVCTLLNTEIATEKAQLQKELDDSLDGLSFIPIVSVGVSYSF